MSFSFYVNNFTFNSFSATDVVLQFFMDSTTFSDPTAADFEGTVANIESALEARALQYISAQANDVMLPTVTGINPVVTIEPVGGT